MWKRRIKQQRTHTWTLDTLNTYTCTGINTHSDAHELHTERAMGRERARAVDGCTKKICGKKSVCLEPHRTEPDHFSCAGHIHFKREMS